MPLQAHLIAGPLPERILRKVGGGATSVAAAGGQEQAGDAVGDDGPPQHRVMGGQDSPRGDSSDGGSRDSEDGRGSRPPPGRGARTPGRGRPAHSLGKVRLCPKP